jgi:UPF0755 protein
VSVLGPVQVGHDEPPPPGHPRVSAAAKLVVALVVLAGVTVGLITLGGSLLGDLRSRPAAGADYDGDGSGSVKIRIERGASAADIGAVLADADVVASPEAFQTAAQADERSRTIQPGSYQLRQKMSAAAALSLLLDPAARLVKRVAVPEGTTLAGTLQLLASKGGLRLPALQAAAKDRGALGLPSYAARAEGYLFPATYEIEPDTTEAQALARMVTRFRQAATETGLAAGAKKVGLSPAEVVVLASLIEGEVARPQDRGKVARVVFNRLEQGMPLQFDSTIQYALGKPKTVLTEAETRIPGPYNTYLNPGLPPGPINNPGEAALAAAVAPEPGDWLYFVSFEKEGQTVFTGSYQEFLRLKQRRNAQLGIN